MKDPLHVLKKEANEKAAQALSYLGEQRKKSEDPLLTLIKGTIAGNIVDYSINKNTESLTTLKKVLTQEISVNHYAIFIEKLKHVKKIQLISDNAGEIVFDLELLKFLQKKWNKKIEIITKRVPFSNDITFKELKELVKQTKLKTSIVKVNNNRYKEYKDNLKRKLDLDSLIISKGQGNYELLSEEKLGLFFIFIVKCPIIAEKTKRSVGDIIFLHQ